MRSIAAALLGLIPYALAASRTSPPSGCLVVSKSPASGQYGTVSAAVKAVAASSSSAPQCIFIYPGTYAEQVLVPSLKTSQLSIYGSTTETSSYGANTVTLTSSLSQANGLSNDETGTLRVKAAGFRLYNVNVNNEYGKGSQAVALSAQADSGYYGCGFTGFQDTLLANSGRQVYSRCLVQGATDFVFGRRGAAWFERCDVRVVSASLGYVTGKFFVRKKGVGDRGRWCKWLTNEYSIRKGVGLRLELLCLQWRHCCGSGWPQRAERGVLPGSTVGGVCEGGLPADRDFGRD